MQLLFYIRKSRNEDSAKKFCATVIMRHDVCVYVVGTLRPDLIESASELASSGADTIKTHHNDTDLVRQLRQQVT